MYGGVRGRGPQGPSYSIRPLVEWPRLSSPAVLTEIRWGDSGSLHRKLTIIMSHLIAFKC